MGCSDSKAAEVKDNKKQPETKQDDGIQMVEDEKTGDVYVSSEEAVKYVIKELGVDQDKAEKMIARIDKDQDGRISNQELVDLWNKVKATRAELENAFGRVDEEGRGYVTQEQALQVLKVMMPGLDEQLMVNMIKYYDKDQDDKIQYDEFVTFYSRVKAKSTEIEKVFNELDKDGSGELETDELVVALQETLMLEEYMIRGLVKDHDINKDGKVNRSEFTNLWARLVSSG